MYRKLILAITLSMALMLTACGGGGGKGEGASSSGGSNSSLVFPLNVVVANARFLLFPNPQRSVTSASLSGTDQTNTEPYAIAYYDAIDAGDERLTKMAWMTKNGFSSGTGTELRVVFGDQKDLGYGRRMTARQSPDGSLAFFVDNYLVDVGGGAYAYSSLNVDAAVVQSAQRFVSTSAIEYSDLDGPGGVNGPKFVKFYVFDTSGVRKTKVDQDGQGEKAMPLICVSCHGGRADRLTVANLFPVVGNAASQQAGDTTSRLQVLKVHTFDFSALTDPTTSSVRTRASQEAAMKTINQWVHDTYANTGDNEWDGTVAQAAIAAAYGGAGFPNANYSDTAAKDFFPAGWGAQPGLYQNAVSPGCMTCHILRGTKNQGDISFPSFAQFSDYADRIKAHVFDRGNMPLVNLVFNEFWKTGSNMPQLFAAVPTINAQGATATLKPGRPIADPGPNRYVRQGTLALTAINSLYASNFSWSLVNNPGNGASFTGSTSGASTSLNFALDGTYVVRLTASGNGLTGTKDITVLVDNAAAPAPASLNFATIQGVFTGAGCTGGGCHSGTLTDPGHPPLSYVAGDYASTAEFLNTVRSRINFTDVVASPLLRKPSGNHHGGALVAGFDTSNPIGNASRDSYDLFVEWIMAGAPL
ncbi:MAG TPA: hypothetical protein VK974_09475 [Methylophilaceae bacterium]|nr:hypothetical protein [Methylophilaceae bacterium]